MTAIAGLWRFDGRPDAAAGCAQMLAAQELYGRHHGAQWSNGSVAFGRRLMRTLPEDVFDCQPLIGGNGRYVLVADARLDNRHELAETLRIPPPQSHALCDAAILLAAAERWEDACVEHLVGDFAFALWDEKHRRLFMARDPLGQRPLHYHRGHNFFAFASMPKGLHALPEVPYAADEEKIAEFLALIPETGSKSFFLGVHRIEPAHAATVTTDGFATRRHWQPSKRCISFPKPDDYAEAFRDLLDQAVQCRLRGMGDSIGTYLSGGFDSGAVTATAARLLAPSGKKVIAFTGVPRKGYDGPVPRNRIVDEGPYAAATAARYPNIEHVLVHNEGHSPFADLDRNFFLLDRPQLGLCSNSWASSFSNSLKARKIKITLGGELGNFGLSYDGQELLPELLRKGQWLQLWREGRALVARGPMRWRGVLANTFGPWCPSPLWVAINKIASGYALEITDYAAIAPRRLVELDLSGRAKRQSLDLVYRPWKDGFAMRTWGLQRVDPGNYRQAGLGGWQIDHRDPTSDVRLLEFCLCVPTEQFMQDGIPRALARRALADRLPKEVLEEPRRGLQSADWHEDLTAARDDVMQELDRLESCPAAKTALDLPRLQQLAQKWPSGGWDRPEVFMQYRYALLRAIAVGHFLRRAAGSN